MRDDLDLGDDNDQAMLIASLRQVHAEILVTLTTLSDLWQKREDLLRSRDAGCKG